MNSQKIISTKNKIYKHTNYNFTSKTSITLYSYSYTLNKIVEDMFSILLSPTQQTFHEQFAKQCRSCGR